MSEVKTLRLSKVARDLNVGVATLVETLNKHGHSIESNPNSKISEDLYLILCKEHQSDVQTKEKSRQLGGTPSPRESVTIDDVKKSEPQHVYDEPQQEVLIKDISLSAPVMPESEPATDTPEPTPDPEPTPAADPEPEQSTEPATEENKPMGGIKVLGKIDLAPKKPVKKAQPKPESKTEPEKATD